MVSAEKPLETPNGWRLLLSFPEGAKHFLLLPLTMGGGDTMEYITFEQLLLFSGFVLALVQCIIAIVNTKKK